MAAENFIPEYVIRECDKPDDFAQCLSLQRIVWQFDDLDITPLRSFVITRHSGGMTYGAFDLEGRLLGFAHALSAFDAQLNPYYYSQMLAVEPSLQNSGIGVKLKLAQREHAFRTGIKLITWTFDPLQSRNAHLNINKLGCVIRKYKVNYYGNYSTSALHRGLDTDRLFAEWWVNSKRITDALAGKRLTGNPEAAVEVPREVETIKQRNMEEARNWQIKIRSEFQNLLDEGLYCAAFETDPASDISRYLFFKDNHEEEN